MNTERVMLGVDGNAGFALLGEDLQSGEAEFVQIVPGPYGAINAAKQALNNLRARLNRPDLLYYLGPGLAT